jgi:hypothetical protein
MKEIECGMLKHKTGLEHVHWQILVLLVSVLGFSTIKLINSAKNEA